MILKKRPSHIFNDNWAVLKKSVEIHKRISVGLCAIILVLLGVLFYQGSLPPLVIQEGATNSYLFAKRKEVLLGKNDIELVMRDFISSRFIWSKFDPMKIVGSIKPLTTEDFQKDTLAHLFRLQKKDFKGKELVQDIAHLKIVATKSKAEAYFDKVLRINGISLIIPTKISFRLKADSRSHLNPRGLYIYKIIETTGVQ